MPAPYRVIYSGVIREQLRRWGEEAKRLGFAQEYAEALRAINARLENEPLEWGDSLHSLPSLGLLICRGFHGAFYVSYGVDEANSLVYLRSFQSQPGHPLAGEQGG
jgi:hypothetical protein